jgi:hypothetical protein
MQFGIESGLVHQLRQPLTVGQGRPGEDGHGRKPRHFCLEFRYRCAFSQGYRLLAGHRGAWPPLPGLGTARLQGAWWPGTAGVGTSGREGRSGYCLSSAGQARWLHLCSKMDRWFADPRTMLTPERSFARTHAGPGLNDCCQDLSHLVLRHDWLSAGGSRNLPIKSYTAID